MSWKGVQGGKPEGEERMRGSALSSPMGVPLGYFHGYKKNEEDKRKRNVRAMLSRLPLTLGLPLSLYPSTIKTYDDKQKNKEKPRKHRSYALSSPMGVPLGYFHGYKKNEEDKRKRNVRAMLSRPPLGLFYEEKCRIPQKRMRHLYALYSVVGSSTA